MTALNNLKNNFPRTGVIEWIGLRQFRLSPITLVNTAELLVGHGLAGDKAGQGNASKRQVTLIQAEYIPVIESFMGLPSISPKELRRNIVISGINLNILQGYRLLINQAVIEITGKCAPCAKMEQALGKGGYNAMRNHGGMTAVVIKGGVIRIGDSVTISSEELS